VTHATDQELIDRTLRGSPEAFGHLVERYQHRLFGTLCRVTGSPEAAQDASQDAFIHAYQKLTTYRGESAFYSWLFRIALNAVASAGRREKRRFTSLDHVRETAGFEPSDDRPGSEPWQGLDTQDRQHAVQQALAGLAEEYRTALVLKEMEDFSYEQIADVLEIPIGTVRSRIHRARQDLRLRLQGFVRHSLSGGSHVEETLSPTPPVPYASQKS
jgi:RNA polymerase sigma-70 factor, ECF subfamily